MRIELARDHGHATFIAVDTVLRPGSGTRAIKRLQFRPSGGGIEFA